jgi:hypothetical protein
MRVPELHFLAASTTTTVRAARLAARGSASKLGEASSSRRVPRRGARLRQPVHQSVSGGLLVGGARRHPRVCEDGAWRQQRWLTQASGDGLGGRERNWRTAAFHFARARRCQRRGREEPAIRERGGEAGQGGTTARRDAPRFWELTGYRLASGWLDQNPTAGRKTSDATRPYEVPSFGWDFIL